MTAMQPRRQFLFSLSATLLAPAAEWHQSAAFQAFYNLDYDAAIESLERESRSAGGDPGPFNHLAYGVLYRALFHAGALDGAVALSPKAFLGKPKVPMDAGDRARFDRALENARNLSWDRLKKNPNNAEALYTLGVAELHRANLLFLVEKEWRPALKQAGEARRLHTEAYSRDKNLVDALLVPSVHEYVVGSLPFYLKALGFLVGYRGDREKGISGIQQVARHGRRTRVEARVLNALVERREGRPANALETMKPLAAEFPSNHLYRMEVVRLLGVLKRHSEGEAELRQLGEKRYRHLAKEKFDAFREEWQTLRRG
jgi:hypothetical protein